MEHTLFLMVLLCFGLSVLVQEVAGEEDEVVVHRPVEVEQGLEEEHMHMVYLMPLLFLLL
jgi:hypothetical protein